MKNPYGGETYIGPPPTNQIEQMINQHFADPALWSLAERPSTVVRSMSGFYEERPLEHWVALLHGCRRAGPNTSGFEPTYATSLETMAGIHTLISRTILEGEESRPSVLVTPPHPDAESLDGDRENALFWLKQITNQKVWPIMATANTHPDGSPIYYKHDYNDSHNALMLLFPRETQNLITRVGELELQWLARYHSGEAPRTLELAGDNPLFSRSSNRRYYRRLNGIGLIDNVTSVSGYVHLLHYLMHGPGATPQDRLRAVEKYGVGGITYEPLDFAAQGLRSMRTRTNAMVDFIARHETGHNATRQDLVDAFAGFKAGAMRVAEKIAGTYEPKVSEPTRSAKIAPWAATLFRRVRILG